MRETPASRRRSGRGRGRSFAIRVALTVVAIAAPACAADRDAEAERVRELLRLEPGRSIADVGAGKGEWTVGLARAVAPGGRVWATEVDSELIDAIRERVEDEELERVEVVLGDERATGLPAACCDAILLRLVYHHLKEPAPILADLDRALRPGGRMLLIETVPQKDWKQLAGVPERGGHGIDRGRLVEELADGGFEAVEVVEEWSGDPERYAVLFRRSSDP
jgi:ubiquinone/menaquinone biosynthesis C-methylase UbiE